MGAMKNFSVALLVVAVAGCALFEELKNEGTQNNQTQDACDNFCLAWIHATEDCLQDWLGCNIDDFDARVVQCAEDCMEVADMMDDDTVWEAIDCMWCVVDEVGYEPTCMEWEMLDFESECESTCSSVDGLTWEFDWWNDFNDNPTSFCD